MAPTVETVGLVSKFGLGLRINLMGGEGGCTTSMRGYGGLFSLSDLSRAALDFFTSCLLFTTFPLECLFCSLKFSFPFFPTFFPLSVLTNSLPRFGPQFCPFHIPLGLPSAFPLLSLPLCLHSLHLCFFHPPGCLSGPLPPSLPLRPSPVPVSTPGHLCRNAAHTACEK